MMGRLPQGDRPKDPWKLDHGALFVVVESRNGLPFRPYVYRGIQLMSGPGRCACGCGERTAISTKTDARYGAIKGQPRRYVFGHNDTRNTGKVA